MIASVREGRIGLPMAEWFVDVARNHGGFDVTLIDLKQVDLPLLSEPAHPRLQQYTQEKTKAWSATVASHDAFVFVTPEYNYSSPPALVNAIDHVCVEWNYKAAGFVSYGGASGGTRSVQVARQMLGALKMMAIPESVHVPFVTQMMEAGKFKGGETHEKGAVAMLTELVRWTDALKVLRMPR
jgi:NAD(P)H-dependent FMN reductase